jgi:hypothetical protein
VNLPLTIIKQTQLALTLGWTPPAGVFGYRFLRDGRPLSSSYDPAKSQATFGLTDSLPHTFEVIALGNLAAGSVAVNGAVPPPPPPGSGWAQFWGRTPPQFNESRRIVQSTQAGLLAAIQAAQAGDLIVYSGASISGEFIVARNGGLAVVDLGAAKILGTAKGSQLPAVWVKGAGGLRFLGGDLTCPGGDGLLVYDANDFEWWGFKIHDTAAQGIHLAGILKACDRVVLHGEVTNCGLDLSQDPHAEPGTGLHGFYSGGSKYPVTNGDWTLDVHDQPHGAAMQINRTRNTRIALRARNITFDAHSQVGGNALQLWATSAENASTWNDQITVDYVEADNVARVVETSGMEAGSLASSKVLVGRGSHIRKPPGYATRAGMAYVDCT